MNRYKIYILLAVCIALAAGPFIFRSLFPAHEKDLLVRVVPENIPGGKTIASRIAPVEFRVKGGKQAMDRLAGQKTIYPLDLSGAGMGVTTLPIDPDKLALRTQWLDEQQELLASGRVGRFAYAAQISKDKESFNQVLQVWLSYWRDVLLRAAETQAPIANLDRVEELEEISARVEMAAAKQTVEAIERTVSLLRTNANVRLAAEVLLLDMPYL